MNAILPGFPASLNRFAATNIASAPHFVRTSLSELTRYGNQLHKAGRRADAETVFRKILDSYPDHPQALLSLGILAHQSGQPDAAIRLLQRVIDVAPNYPQAHCNLGIVYNAIRRYDDAVACFVRATELHPRYAEAYFNLGAVRRARAEYKDALVAFEHCRAITSNRADLYYEIGHCCLKLNDRFQAQIAFRSAIAIDPKHASARNSMGTMLCLMNRYEQAEAEFRAALKINGKDLEALNGLSECRKRLGAFDEALDLLKQAHLIDPHDLETLNNLASMYQTIGDNDLAAEYYDRVLALAPGAECAEKSTLFVALNRPSLTSDELFALHRRLRGRHDRVNEPEIKFAARSRDPNRKLRVGYVSSDFRLHVVALNITPLIGNHDRKQVEIFLYAQEKSTDHMTLAFKQYCDRYTTINNLSDSEAAALIEKDEIDILVLLAGRFDENRPLIAAHRAAPIQISYHDCATSGLADMDYWLTDSILHPAETPEQFSEQLYRLPVYYQYPVQDGLPEIAPPPARENGFITFGSFNKPEKINSEVISLWADVLRAVPGSKLFLKYFNHYSEESMQRIWIDKFAAFGIDADRLILKARADNRPKHLTLYNDVDIALDPFPFNGATTTFEALSMGVPVVTLTGRHFVDRVAASMVTHAGYADLAADDRAGYVARAQALAEDVERLAELRATMRDKLHASALCNGTAYAESVEAAYRDMWQTWIATGGYRGK